MSFEDNPADDRYQLDQCIDEIKSLQVDNSALREAVAVLRAACKAAGDIKQDTLDGLNLVRDPEDRRVSRQRAQSATDGLVNALTSTSRFAEEPTP